MTDRLDLPRRYAGQHFETKRPDGVTQAMKYTVVIDMAPNNYAAYVPDLPGCVATAKTREELLEEIREAIEFHIEGMRQDGEPVLRTPDYCCGGGRFSDGNTIGSGGGRRPCGTDMIDALALGRVPNLWKNESPVAVPSRALASDQSETRRRGFDSAN